MKRTYPKRILKHHYTIVEMMMVVAIFIIIMAMATAAWLNSGSEAKLKRAVRMVTSQLNLARSKAIAERTDIGVYFSFDNRATNKNQKCGLYYYDGTTRGKAVPGEPELFFPSGTLAIVTTMQGQTDTFSYSLPDNMFFSFNAKGRLVHWSQHRPGTDNDSFETLQAIWVTSADKQRNNTLQIVPDEAYYEVDVNTFTGRIKTIYHEVNN